LLIIYTTCFGLSSWPSSGSPEIFITQVDGQAAHVEKLVSSLNMASS